MTDKIMMELAKLQTTNRRQREQIKVLESNLRNRDEQIHQLKLDLQGVKDELLFSKHQVKKTNKKKKGKEDV
jgi:septal ring factor EnvC (AmiA/AmiB activator)